MWDYALAVRQVVAMVTKPSYTSGYLQETLWTVHVLDLAKLQKIWNIPERHLGQIRGPLPVSLTGNLYLS